MPKVTEGGLDRTVCVEMKIVRNGVSVSAHRDDTGQSMDYVYENLNKALKEIPAIVSVLSDRMPEITEEKLDEEEEKINKEAKKEKEY